MGVKDLWNVIESSCDTVSLDTLKNKTIAIDLAGWAVDSQCLKAANDAQINMHLRNLFYRTKALLLQGTIPVFVLEGKPPELKKKVIAERLNIREGKSKDAEIKDSRCNRRGLNRILKACERMLNLMGLECVKAHGEAEAMCAYLNADGLVDGCITQDGDCFLYGAKTIYRKFTMAGKAGTGGTAEEYSIEKIESMYKLGRNKLIALALLCGCDYTPGVNQIGQKTALKFFSHFEDSEILRRMKSWRYDKSPAPTKEERVVKSKCVLLEDFPNQEVIDEFLIRKGSIPTRIDNWKRPNGAALVEFLAANLFWEVDFTVKHVLPLVTRWQVLNFMGIPEELRPNDPDILIPKEIKKTRKPGTVLSFEIEWTISRDSNYFLIPKINEQSLKDTELLCTVECQHYVIKSYPQLVQAFEDLQAAKKKPQRKPRKGKTADVEEKTGQSPKQKKTKGKKEEVPCKRIDNYFQQRKCVSSRKPEKSGPGRIHQPETSRPQNREKLRENSASKLDGTLKQIYDDLSPEDFASDVDADCAEMSMVVQRTCSQTNTILPALLSLQSDGAPQDYLSEEKTRPSPIKEVVDIVDISSDDDIVYVPLGERLKARG
ncbi:flap endonuclease GEN [Diachasma alloeum]|uniref:flap endonuclease GEN n=1 Tax=Diachasma alloeum TaxID=454923 RepID=UPI0007382810|nr:flap endonuclease GEN [Diachasma alloeum]